MTRTINANGFTYVVSDEKIQNGDMFLLNNSTVNNKTKICDFIYSDGTIQPVSEDLVIRKIPVSMCKKIISTNDLDILFEKFRWQLNKKDQLENDSRALFDAIKDDLKAYDDKQQKIFINGFASWMETHHEVCEFIGYRLKESELLYTENVINETESTQGTGGLYTLAEQWTDEFEKLNEGRVWDGEFFNEIGNFLNEKNKIN